MDELNFTIPYKNYVQRLGWQGWLGIGMAIVVPTVAYCMVGLHLFTFIFMAFGLFNIVLMLVRARLFVSAVQIIGDRIIVSGYTMNTPWEKTFDIKASSIAIKTRSQGKGQNGYFLEIKSANQSVSINQMLHWEYLPLITIFRKFKLIKGESINATESARLDRMGEKPKGAFEL